MSRRTSKVYDAPAFVLQSSAWRETSLILRVLARDHGVITLVAKGAKRPYSALRAVLLPFQALSLSWSGNGDIKTLTHAEVVTVRPMPGATLMSCWYMNELLLRLLASEDPHPGLYDAYGATIVALAQGKPAAAALRQFEWTMLRETGYGLEGQAPDFEDRRLAVDWRQQLQQRLLEHLPGGQLNSRQVMHGLRRLTEPAVNEDSAS